MRRVILISLLKFMILFGILIAPWPGLKESYGSYFRALGGAVFHHEEGKRILSFEPKLRTRGLASMDSQIVLANRELLDAQGHGPVRVLGIDSRSIGWIPTALTLSLILASPVPWKRKGISFIYGLLLIQIYILFVIAIFIWNQSTLLQLLTFSPFLKTIADALEYTLVNQMGAGFTAAVAIWILVTFRLKDLDFHRL